MQQEIRNVLVTFLLLVTSSTVGSMIYRLTARQQAQQAVRQQTYQVQQAAATRILEAKLEALAVVKPVDHPIVTTTHVVTPTTKPAPTTTVPVATPTPVSNVPTAAEIAAKQQVAAQLQAEQQAQLQAQIRAAQVAAQQQAMQQQMQLMQQARMTSAS